MARLLQVFGFLSVLFRGATLTFQSLAIGGIVFLIFVVRRANEDSSALEQACLLDSALGDRAGRDADFLCSGELDDPEAIRRHVSSRSRRSEFCRRRPNWHRVG